MSTNSDKLDRVLELLESRSDLEEQVRSLRAEVKSLRDELGVHTLTNHGPYTWRYDTPTWTTPTVWSDSRGNINTSTFDFGDLS